LDHGENSRRTQWAIMKPKQDAPTTGAGDVHERIRREAGEIRSLGACHYSEIETRPALAALLHAATQRIESAIPATIVHEGQTYFLCVRVAYLEIGVHKLASDATPLVHVVTQGGRWCGHAQALRDSA
jgi:hypothetical protein